MQFSAYQSVGVDVGVAVGVGVLVGVGVGVLVGVGVTVLPGVEELFVAAIGVAVGIMVGVAAGAGVLAGVGALSGAAAGFCVWLKYINAAAITRTPAATKIHFSLLSL